VESHPPSLASPVDQPPLRVLQFGAWVSDEVLAPVPHRQYVFTVPKMLRGYFRKDRRRLGKLSHCADDALKTVYRRAMREPKGVPGVIISIQTFGDLVNFHPHLHVLVTDGVFGPSGWFYAVPRIDLRVLEALFRHRVLRMLLQERRIDEALVRKLLGWRHSGFSVHNDGKIPAQDTEGRRTVAEYILRSPFALEKLRYHAKTGTIIDRSKMHAVLKRNFEVVSALDWLAALTAPIPNHGEQLVRYYGWDSNVSRGKRKKAQPEGPTAAAQGVVEVELSAPGRAAKREWARLIKQVYEADPRLCPRCGGAMRIIAFIEQPAVIEQILTHLGLWPARAHSPPAGDPLPFPRHRVVAA
jgi:Putative transposase